MSGKRLELIRDVVPKISRMAVFGTSDQPGNAQTLKETEVAARNFGVEIQVLYVTNSKDLEAAFQTARKSRSDAGLVLSSAVIFSQRPQIARLAADNRLPIMFPQSEYVEDGGLMSYAPNYPDMSRRAAYYVDKILKGAKPADLPVEQPTKFELLINLKAAKQIGLTIPPNVLARADRVIK
jgi:putative ABC transport system substrate-binding protein